MKNIIICIFCGLFLFVFACSAVAQNYEVIKKELIKKQNNTRYEIQTLKEQIESYQQRISETEDRFQRLYEQYQNLQKELELRNKLVEKLKTEQSHIEQDINITEKALHRLEHRLDSLVHSYRQSLIYLYKHGRNSQLALLLTSNSFNQMLVRSKYLQKFEEHRQKQQQEIEEARQELMKKNEQLKVAREKNQSVLDEIQNERETLKQKTEKQKQNIAELRQNRSKLEAKLKETRKQIEELNNMLTALIIKEEEVRKAQEERLAELERERKRRLAEARKIEDPEKREAEIAKYSRPIGDDTNLNAPDAAILREIETEFSKMQGSFPMPVENGVITEEFGTQVHPVYGTKINNPGVEIAAEPRSAVRAVYDGFVYAIQPIRGYGDVVLINHGKYKTVYANLSEIMVSKGTFLKAGEIIGLSGDENSTLGASIFFMIRQGKKNLNPETWFATK